jgi:hypothetical protein
MLVQPAPVAVKVRPDTVAAIFEPQGVAEAVGRPVASMFCDEMPSRVCEVKRIVQLPAPTVTVAQFMARVPPVVAPVVSLKVARSKFRVHGQAMLTCALDPKSGVVQTQLL